MADLVALEQKLEHRFANPDLLKQALIHRSYLNEHPELKLEHNERLEFLGDAVLELVVTRFLFEKYPNRPEGELTAFRAALVNADTLAEMAQTLDLNDCLLLSRGEAKDAGRARQTILANAVEAVLGALERDGGYAAAERVVAKYLLPRIDEMVEKNLWQDAKSRWQELAQAKRGVTPTYELLSAIGPDHNKKFTVAVNLDGQRVAEGVGPSKQRAEQDAARNALAALGWN